MIETINTALFDHRILYSILPMLLNLSPDSVIICHSQFINGVLDNTFLNIVSQYEGRSDTSTGGFIFSKIGRRLFFHAKHKA